MANKIDAILFSADPARADVAKDAIPHLEAHPELYWTVGYPIDVKKFAYPLAGFIHVKGQRVKYKASIRKILPFSPSHYEDPALKPLPWREDYKRDPKPGKMTLVLTKIVSFEFDTLKFQKPDGTFVAHEPEGYVAVVAPS